VEKDLIINLNEIRKELEIPMDDFIRIIAIAIMHRRRSKIKISDEMLYEIIISSLSDYDYIDNNKFEKKSSIDAIRLLLSEERKERNLSDAKLFDFIEDELDEIEGKKEKKNPDELVERAIKSLGY